MESNKNVLEILDYWFAIEFLAQESYEVCTSESEIIRKFKKFKNASKSIKDKRKQITVFEKINEQLDIHDLIVKQAEECNMETWGNLTFYIGKIRRQICIEKLAGMLGIKQFEQAEKSFDYIPVLSFQCRSDGTYIENSLSLSTVVWALSQLAEQNKISISEALSVKTYSNNLKELENYFFKLIKQENKEIVSDSKDLKNNDFITSEMIDKIHNNLVNLYGKYVGEKSIEKNNVFKYQLFSDSEAKQRYCDDNYMGLSHDFYSNDLKMVKKAIEERKYDLNSGIMPELIKYICGPKDITQKRERYDFINIEDKDEFMNNLLEILNIGNAPLGKWPSRYMPALMQQVAINLSISNNDHGIFEKKGKIFSVNGPPGTGKTTLLKEIIANNIVEKACILSQYDIPDDAFEKVNFVHGKYANGAYSQYYPSWYRFKDNRIADYGILVASCNNNAVENITKELPLKKGILDNLNIIDVGDNADSTIMQKKIMEIRELFSINDKNNADVYFTSYARKFLGNDKQEADAWGLIAASLGKKSNISKFYYDVIAPLLDFLKSNNDIKKRIFQYKNTKENFRDQLEKVQTMKEQIKKCCDLAILAHQRQISFKKMKKKNENLIKELQLQIGTINQKVVNCGLEINKKEIQLKKLESNCNYSKTRIADYEKRMKIYSEQALKLKEQIFKTENSVSFITKIFRKSKYNAALDLVESYKKELEKCINSGNEVQILFEQEKIKYGECVVKRDDVCKILTKLNKSINQFKNQLDLFLKKINLLELEIKNSERLADEANEKYNNFLECHKNTCDIEQGKILDKEFIKNILSEDISSATEAQITNPWVTEEYNREREKLFYQALQLSKEFLLSSKSCRANLNILGQYWNLKSESDIKNIVFHKEDREAMIDSLLQTLFLLTPVISSTFASIGNLLKDVKKPGVIGTLIIDEAGQAQPQMAVGALFRARRALIVGDPKQVEPVVTDDLELLKDTYTMPIYSNYKNKSISVQSCADIINPFGTYIENGTDFPDWIGCPLLVHRRCISPMYDISNIISYNGLMKQKTSLPSQNITKSFIYSKSQWINVSGAENGYGDHYVSQEGKYVCQMIEKAFTKTDSPNVFIISPFTSVIRGIRNTLKSYAKRYNSKLIGNKFDEWLNSNIGTVHKFQGKEANEVIFLLGCDETQKNRYCVKGFVNSNIVNVAMTRAKYRIYIVGNSRVWKHNQYVSKAKSIIETLPIKKIIDIEKWDDSAEKDDALISNALQLPSLSSFMLDVGKNEDGEIQYDIDSDDFISYINKDVFLNVNLEISQYQKYGFTSKNEFETLPIDIKRNLIMGIKLYDLLKPIYEKTDDLDASCCGILFCKCMELQLQKNFIQGFKKRFPQFRINGNTVLKNAQVKDFMIGTFKYVLKENTNELEKYMCKNGKSYYSKEWWKAFIEKLELFRIERNKCCHSGIFKWNDMMKLIDYEFYNDLDIGGLIKIGGLFHESKIGKELEK